MEGARARFDRARFMTPDGLVICSSDFTFAETADRVAAAVIGHGMATLARIDHAAAAAKVGLALRPTEVIAFGNAKVGTPLMQAEQTIGIDLPLKILIWQDFAGKIWLGYDDPVWLARRHGVAKEHDEILAAMSRALATITGRIGRSQ